MSEAYITLTPVHWFYLVGVLVILLTMILRRDTPLVCIVFLFGIGLVGQRSLAGDTDHFQFYYLCHQRI